MTITPEELEDLLKNASEEQATIISQMLDEADGIPEPSKSMSTEQYAKSREDKMFERMPLEDDEDYVKDVGDSGEIDIIMYSDFIEDEEEGELSSQYYSGDEEDSQIEILKELENNIGAGKKDDKWYPHESVEGGNPTVAYGHKVTDEEVEAGTYDDGLTEEEAIELLKIDIDDANRKVRDKIEDFDSFPFYLKMELVNSAYRGLIQGSPDTLDFINEGNFEAAADEFTNNVPAYKDSDGIKKRMDRVVDALRKYAQELDD
tara:strand:+ start:4234 stop:5016 length:783 start_codon:yes stop_codon:yes gene_type:complete